MLRNVNVQRELEAAFTARGLDLESIIASLENIAMSKPEKVTAADIIKANLELLKFKGVA